jgi:hypothetical protein
VTQFFEEQEETAVMTQFSGEIAFECKWHVLEVAAES